MIKDQFPEGDVGVQGVLGLGIDLKGLRLRDYVRWSDAPPLEVLQNFAGGLGKCVLAKLHEVCPVGTRQE